MNAKLIIMLAFLGASHFSMALTTAGEYQITLLAQGGPASIKNTSESIYRSGSAEVEVSDALAEVLLQNYLRGDKQYTDALSWAAKALGSTRNPRYTATLQEVLEKSGNKKLNKYAESALDMLDKKTVAQYMKGSINLEALRENSTALASTQATVKPEATTTNASGKIADIKPGMSMQEVFAICGEPTSTTSHVTGKAWIPFNFKGGDNVRTYALYKGQGKVVFNKTSQYTSTWKVLEVIIDPAEVILK